MSLRTKVILAWVITTVALFVVLYVALSRILLSQFLQLETLNTLNHVQRARQALDNELETLRATTTDWASWDDSYEFMQTGSEDFVDSNLMPETLETLRLNILLYVTPAGAVFRGRAYDLQTRQLLPLPADLLAQLPALHQLTLSAPGGPMSGLLVLPEGPLIFAVQPILTSHEQGPPRGALLMARFLDAPQVELLSDLIQGSVTVQSIQQADPLLSAATLHTLLDTAGTVMVLPLDAQTVTGYVALTDIYGSPALLLRVSNDREIYQATLITVRLIGLALLLIGIVFGVLAVILLERVLLTRVSRLAADVHAIGTDDATLALRTGVTGSDELTELARSINSMLDRLAASHQARLDSEARYRSMVEQSSEGILLVNVQTRAIMDANPRVCELLGYTPAEICTVTLYDLVALAPPALDANIERVLTSGHFHVAERHYRRRDGTLIPIEVTAVLLQIENRQAISILLHDITQRKQMELVAREQQTLTEALRDTAAALSSTLDFDELLDRILDNVGKVLPHDTSEIMLITGDIAQIVRVRGYNEPNLAAFVLSLRFRVEETANLRHMLQTGLPLAIPDTRTFPGWVALPEIAWLRSLAGAPIRRKGVMVGLVTVGSATAGFYQQAHAERLQAFADQAGVAIENAHLYEAVQQHAAEMEKRVAERTHALLEANVKLRELDVMKSQFVSNVSHELRTPLANIKLYLTLLASGKPERHAQYMTTLHREANLLHRLIEDLLQISRLDLDKTTPTLVPVDVNHLLITLAQDREPLVNERGLTLHLLMNAAPLWAQADNRLLIQILTTLMTNAMNYTAAGGTITLRSFVAQSAGAEWVCVAVNDTGPGIPVEEQAQVFNRFFRGQAALHSKVPGTGLGLAICQEIVKLHGGHLTLDSQVGQGSTFTVMLKPALSP